MTNETVYNDMRGPLEVSTSTYEQELFYCEFSDQQIEQVRDAFSGDLQRASKVYRVITDELLMAVKAEDIEKPLMAVSVADLIEAHTARNL
ncbi:MAG: hypothetical protein RMX26_03105 [Planktomarina sp.]|nr:hypothetical protein [Planktomarina sp.]|tara:strand:- start:145 stop:417 length:273 start_codon:yes stop_codon:yes gene_type:complete